MEDKLNIEEKKTQTSQALDEIEEINEALAGNLKLDSIIDSIIEKLFSILKVSSSSIWIWNESDKTLELNRVNVYSHVIIYLKKILGKDLSVVKLYTGKQNGGENFMWKSLQRNKPIFTKNLYDISIPMLSKRQAELVQKLAKIKLAVSVPLIIKDTELGCLALSWNEDKISNEDYSLIRIFSNQISFAMYNSRLYEKKKTKSVKLDVKNIEEEIFKVLKNYNNPIKLAKSNLLELEVVKERARKNATTEVIAFREILDELIEYLKPRKDEGQRTTQRLRYEIVKMIAYKESTESQIMWDLGFDVFTRSAREKLTEDFKPRFPYTKLSEYSATSDRSFKRLKKEAIDILCWKLKEICEENR
ncbi:hypothetical protein JW887_04585 [Candidatus Dojkabacteria bacterium]|nr:hypothetical protein [Candidatus Dojkabacteria bacterium]